MRFFNAAFFFNASMITLKRLKMEGNSWLSFFFKLVFKFGQFKEGAAFSTRKLIIYLFLCGLVILPRRQFLNEQNFYFEF